MVLIDDENKTVIEPLFTDTDHCKKLYDFDLMMHGGHITGYQIADDQKITQVITALQALADPKTFQSKYHVDADK